MKEEVVKLGRGLKISWRSILVLAVVLVVAASSLNLSWASSSKLSLTTVPMPGVVGGNNNINFAYSGQYAILAAFAPSVEPPDDATLDDRFFDNHYVYGVDTQKPGSEVTRTDLHIYYPSTVKFDSERNRVYARGINYVRDKDGVVPADAVSYLTINKSLQLDGNVVSFNIPGIGGTRLSTGAPTDIALGRVGENEYFFCTNGASIFTFNIALGSVYQLDVVPPSYFSENYTITNFGYDPDNALLTVVVCGRNFKKGHWQYFSDLFCYRLLANGSLPLVKQVLWDGFPEAIGGGTTAVTPDSNVEITPDGTQAFFVTDDGSLCTFRLDEPGFDGNVTRLASFPELAVTDDDRSPRRVNYNAATNSIAVVKAGYGALVKRPIYRRPGGNGVKRPIYIRSQESPALVLVQFNKKNKVSGRTVITRFGDQAEVGLSNITINGPGQGLIATYGGNLFAIDFDKHALSLLGSIGPRTDSLTYNAEGMNVVGINSFDDSGKVAYPGAVAIAKLSSDSASAVSLTAAVLSPFSLGGHSISGIRRPCTSGR